ncbi:MAG: flagellar basal-body rod protein FlgF [Pseudomonadota bacterium]|jgi:flagellar basal-body rod protein FlgG
MDSATYSAASNGIAQIHKLDLVSNNLANVNTPGFKRQILIYEPQEFEETLASLQNLDETAAQDIVRTAGVTNLRTETDFSPGPIKNTGNVFDVALRNPKDFFAVATANGIEYTRAGNFTLNPNGELVTHDGFVVQGDGGPITVNGPGASISPAGIVRTKAGDVGRLQVVRFDDTSGLERTSAARFTLKAGGAAPNPVEADIVPQAIEMSNVSAITGVLGIISANRAFQAYAKSAETIDAINQAAISQLGKARF